MKVILETERLILRELTINDDESFYYLNLNPNVIKYTGDSSFANIKEAKSFLENYSDYIKNGFGRWAVIEKQSNNFIGWCGLKFHKDTNEIDIGFRFFEEYWNKGFATESAKSCLEYGFLQLNLTEIIGRVMKENLASIKVLEKIGLQFSHSFNFENNEGYIYKLKKEL